MSSKAYRDPMIPPEEVRRILRRAAELEDAERTTSPGGRGHTLDEVERIARDAGISPEALRRAMAGEEGPSEPPPRHPWSLAGAPDRVSIDRTVRGDVGAEGHAKVAKAIGSTLGELGNVRSTGDSLRWASSGIGGRRVEAVVEPAGNGQVRVRVDEDMRPYRNQFFNLAAFVAGVGMCVVVAITAFLFKEGVPLAFVSWMVGLALASRVLYARRFRAREAQVAALVAQVAAVVAPARPRIALEGSGARVAPDGREEDAVEAGVEGEEKLGGRRAG